MLDVIRSLRRDSAERDDVWKLAQACRQLLTERGELGNPRDYLVYFYPGHRLARSVEEAAALDPAAGPLFIYADADTWTEGSLASLDGSPPVVIEYHHPQFPHRMLRWASNPATAGAARATGPAAPRAGGG